MTWPKGLLDAVIRTFDRDIDKVAARDFLCRKNGWPKGIAEALIKSCKKIPIRFFIADDSGSMSTLDGNKMTGSGKESKMIQCSRWAELVQTMNFIGDLSELIGAVTEFRLLNGADPVLTGMQDDNGESLTFLKDVFKDEPAGKTPLCAQINQVVDTIRSLEKDLLARGKRAAVIIATDGESTDGDVARALKPLEKLPVWVVIRLCTDEEPIVTYWDDIDNQLELDIDVLDDIVGEGKQVKSFNDWITYGEPLHRLREFGEAQREMDLLDEGLLSVDGMLSVVSMLLLESVAEKDSIPHPEVDPQAFLKRVDEIVKKQQLVFCPVQRKMVPWVSLAGLKKSYSKRGANGASGAKSCVVS
jgi:hypothetical protein